MTRRYHTDTAGSLIMLKYQGIAVGERVTVIAGGSGLAVVWRACSTALTICGIFIAAAGLSLATVVKK